MTQATFTNFHGLPWAVKYIDRHKLYGIKDVLVASGGNTQGEAEDNADEIEGFNILARKYGVAEWK